MKQTDDARIQGIADPRLRKLLQDISDTKRNIDDGVERIAIRDTSPSKEAEAVDGVAIDNVRMTNPSREEMKYALQATQSDVSAIAEKLRADLAEHRGDMRTAIGDMKAATETLRGDLHKATSENIKWAVGTALSLAAVSVTILTFVINNAAKTPQVQQPQQQPQPVIVNVLPAATPASPQQGK